MNYVTHLQPHLFRTLFFIRKTSSNFVYIIYFDYLTLNMFLLLSIFFFGFVLRLKYGLCAMLIILSILWCCFGWMIKMIMCVTISLSLSLFVSFALVVLSGIPTSPIHSHAKTEPPHAPNQPPHNTNPDRNPTALPPSIHTHAYDSQREQRDATKHTPTTPTATVASCASLLVGRGRRRVVERWNWWIE